MHVYCSGIGGIGLSAYAALMRARGHTVSGSDRSDSPLLEDLRQQGISIILRQDGNDFPADVDLFVYSEAVPVDAPERVIARDRGIESLSYFHAVGELSKNYFLISICGTHGKSSTTAMVARLLIAAGKDPTVIVGTKMPELGNRNFRAGTSKIFVLESCEYRRSFHFLSPSIALMTNVDGDHFDAYATLEEYQDAFVEFLKRLPSDGVVITHATTEPDCARVAAASGRSVIDADSQPELRLSVPGKHMRENAKLALALAEHLGIDRALAQTALEGFRGTWRRMELKGTYGDDILVVDDYAHHPREIRASLQAMRETYPDRRIVVAFQPHTHDRILKLYKDFLASFTDADLVVIPDVYNARSDIETAFVDVDALVSDIARESSVPCFYCHSLKETEVKLREEFLKPHDVLVCVGAGDITQLASHFAP